MNATGGYAAEPAHTVVWGGREVAVGQIEAVEAVRGLFRTSVRLRLASGEVARQKIRRRNVVAEVRRIDEKRLAWWRKALPAAGIQLADVVSGLETWARGAAYVRRGAVSHLQALAASAAEPFAGRWPEGMPDTRERRDLVRIRKFLDDPRAAASAANEHYAGREIERSGRYLDGVEARPLTNEQRRAVVTDDDRNLVVAAAGSGKTSVMVAKAGWLARTGRRRPDEVLLLAFARPAQEELAERLRARLGTGVADGMHVRTFHALGLAIIGEAEGRRPAVAKVAGDERALRAVLERISRELLAGGEAGGDLLRWFAYDSAPYRRPHEFESWDAYWGYVRSHDIRSLKGDQVKSFEECRIANFLYLNGIDYEYEREYEHDTATVLKGPYKPDFRLSESGIYIEHFALSADGSTPPFIDREKYSAEREWKLELHGSRGTVLVQTFSHEQAAGRLTENLERKLRGRGVVFRPIPREAAFDALNEQGRVGVFARLAATFLAHFKGQARSFEEIAESAAETRDADRTESFLRVFRPVFERYEERLADAGEVDFHDMIARASEHVRSGRYRSPFGYILVDEFQDISRGRAALLQALLAQREDAQLFVVGDDWQAIHRFAGGDIALMREFDEHFGAGARCDLETTFRCAEGVSDVATRFVLRNPRQIEKKVRAGRKVAGCGVLVGAGPDGNALLRDTLERIAADAPGGGATVLVLGRYRHAKPHGWDGLRRSHRTLDLSYRTVHAAKGLEADYVVVLGVRGGKYGFPSEIADDPLLDLVLAAPEAHPNAEERRLFYVALTRARRRAFVLVDAEASSAFAQELTEGSYAVEIFGESTETQSDCPYCGGGRLVARRNRQDGSMFYGCTNYPYCEHNERPCPACGDGRIVREGSVARCVDCGATRRACPRCDGRLVERRNRRDGSTFYGCTNYPGCRHTEEPGRRTDGGTARTGTPLSRSGGSRRGDGRRPRSGRRA